MKVVITGNMGYVGPVLASHLRRVFRDATLVGFDSGLFAHCLTTMERFPESQLSLQVFGDVRDLDAALLQGADAVVHLAAVSNDPMGNRFESVTDGINFQSSIDIARKARDAGVRNFVFASSCSVYGFAEGGARKESDALNPLTAYARSKISTEKALQEMQLGSMNATCLRFATACGMSDRLRLDLVLNDFVAGALTSKEIGILSDGTPWRPLIDVRDMARAIEWAIGRESANGGQFLSVNAGSDQWNYQVRELAQAVAEDIAGTQISVDQNAPPDKRSYKVDFSLFRSLAPNHQPIITLAQSVQALRDGLRAANFSDSNFRASNNIRLRVLDEHIASGRLTEQLRWTNVL